MINPATGREFASSDAPASSGSAEKTGRFIVEFRKETSPNEMISALRDAGLSNIASSLDFDRQAIAAEQIEGADATVLSEIQFAFTDNDPSRAQGITAFAETDNRIIAVVPEYVQSIRSTETPVLEADVFQDTDEFTWGLIATQTNTSPFLGAGIRLTVLDTGFSTKHPDFAERSVTTHSFITNESAEDGHGHGTHCVGTSSGPQNPTTGPRYGIAGSVEIYAGKVLSNSGSGADGTVLAGINWAVANGSEVISLSLGADVPEVSPVYTDAGRRALNAGSLIIAAAGNNANRPSDPGFVGTPANSPYIAAVGALDHSLDPTFFSARSGSGRGGQVDIAAPGLKVYSSWTLPDQYNVISGTSMATPHVAGIAALWAEATGLRGAALWSVLVQEAQRLFAPSVDVGSGLARAPQGRD